LIEFALFPEFRFAGIPFPAKNFYLHKISEAFDAIDMELGISNEIDLALFIDHDQNTERGGQEFFKKGIFLAGEKDSFALFGSFLVGAFVIDEGILNIPFAKLEPSGGNAKIGVDLAVQAFKGRATGEKDLPDTAWIGTPRLDLKTQGTHQSLRKASGEA
jgi:hypothetical protein